MMHQDPAAHATANAGVMSRSFGWNFAWFFGVFLIVFGGCLVWIVWLVPTWHEVPGTPKDDVFYDSLAFQLAQGNGFRLNFEDPEWLRPYTEANTDGRFDWIVDARVDGLTTSRAPLFPGMVAVVYRVMGRNWDVVRILNAVLLAVGLASLATWVRSVFGPWAAGITVSTLLLDYGVMTAAGQVVTEPLGICLFLLSFTFVLKNAGQKGSNKWGWLVSGCLFGLALLTRTNFAGWLVPLALFVAICALGERMRRALNMKLLAASVWFFVGVIGVVLPWAVRNCLLANAFVPLGTAGSIGFAGGYCDAAFQSSGNWDGQAVVEAQARAMTNPDLWDQPLAVQEVAMGRESIAAGMQWIRSNPEKVPQLAAAKALSHLALSGQPHGLLHLVNALLLLGAIIGVALSWRQFGFWVALATSLSILTAVVTWAHFGRFSLPVRPLWHASSAIGITLVFKAVWLRGRESEPNGA